MGRVKARPSESRSHSPDHDLATTSLTQLHIQNALLKSTDNGATLDLSNLGLLDVGDSGAERLASIGRQDTVEDESPIIRIALGHNRLATLPNTFALLSRLRYINLRSNSFAVFPAVLTQMPALEILDIRRNKIKRFPAQPGKLVNLRVLCISRNKISRLPSYLADFHALDNLGIDHNPIEWPPRPVIEPHDNLEDKHVMRDWVKHVKEWISEHSLAGQDRIFSDGSLDGHGGFNFHPQYAMKNFDREPSTTPHARNISADSDLSMSAYSISEPSPTNARFRISESSPSPRAERPPPLQLHTLQTPGSSKSRSPPRSPDSYLPTPEESVVSTDEEITQTPLKPPDQHARNASYAGSRDPLRLNLTAKKSLPDLRTTKLNNRDPNGKELPTKIPIKSFTDEPPSSAFRRLRQDSGSSDGPLNVRVQRPFVDGLMSQSPTTMHTPGRSVDVERNAYFRRFSTVNQAAVATTIPTALGAVVDGARAVLYAMTQLHQTVINHATHMTDERLGMVLKKILDPSFRHIEQLIISLDRFDALSNRRTIPNPSVCRTLMESCKDCVAVFNRVIKALVVQVKVIVARDDPLYVRSLLLQIWGASAELSEAWQRMMAGMDAAQPFLREHRPPPTNKFQTVGHSPTADTPVEPPASAPATTTMSPFGGELQSPPLSSVARSRSITANAREERARKARRHAGSFSVQDVQKGRFMLSHLDSPPPLPDVMSPQSTSTPTPRGPQPMGFPSAGPSDGSEAAPPRKMSKSAIGLSPTGVATSNGRTGTAGSSSSARPSPTSARPPGGHSREASQASAIASSSSSPALSSKLPGMDMPTTPGAVMDENAVVAMSKAVEAAPPVWEMLDDIMQDFHPPGVEFEESVAQARAVTARFTDRIKAIQATEPSVDRVALRDDARVFLKTVIHLSNIIKAYDGTRVPTSIVRAKMVRLTNATEEFVILLHASSFASSSMARPHSPMVVVTSGGEGQASTRSRSTTQGPPAAPTREPPGSATPLQQSFAAQPLIQRHGEPGDGHG